jgi:hypothetical protein
MNAVDPRAVLAAHNNADLYQLVFDAQNLKFTREPHVFIALDPPPPYYSQLTTLSCTQTGQQLSDVLRLRDMSRGEFSLKDGFSLLNLTSEGFHILFEASWVWVSSNCLPKASNEGWERIQNIDDLTEWERCWKDCGSPTEHHMFPESMLNLEDMAFFGHMGSNGIEAGCIANLSKDCVGLSNVFSRYDIDSALAVSAGLAAGFGGGRPVVGYDRGRRLELLVDIGFETVGPLRVWITEEAK